MKGPVPAATATLLCLAALLSAGEPPPDGGPGIPEPPGHPGQAAGTPGQERERERPELPGGGKLTISAVEASRRARGPAPDGRELYETVFAGEVEAVRGTLRLNCARLSAVMAGTKGTGTGGEPLSCTAEGGVVVRDGESKAVAERAEYDCLTERLTLSGARRPVIYHRSDAVAAESFVLHRRREMFEARGRTSAVIMPRGKAPDEAVPAPTGREDKDVPSLKGRTRLDCSGGAVYEERRNLLFMRDDVLVRQEGYEMSCDRAWALFRPRERKKAEKDEAVAADADEAKGDKPASRVAGIADAPQAAGAGPGQLMQVMAAGRVRVRSATRSAEAELVSYDAAARTLTLSGGEPGPVIREGDSWLTAPLIVYHLDGDRIESPNGPFKAVVRNKDLKR